MKYFIIIALLMFSTPAKAAFHIGTALNDWRIGNQHFTTLKESEPSLSYNVGYYKEFENKLIVDFTTNALTPNMLGSDERATAINNKAFHLESEITYVNMLMGTRLKGKFNNIVPALLMAYVQADTKAYNSKDDVYYLIKDRTETIVFGANVNYFFSKKFSISSSIIFPDTKLNLKQSYSMGLNYYF